jgi:hypothetical protein
MIFLHPIRYSISSELQRFLNNLRTNRSLSMFFYLGVSLLSCTAFVSTFTLYFISCFLYPCSFLLFFLFHLSCCLQEFTDFATFFSLNVYLTFCYYILHFKAIKLISIFPSFNKVCHRNF